MSETEVVETAPYQVIARKYRPQAFAQVVGQEAIVTTLRHALKLNRVGHAYLFCGMRGTGKTTLARLFAKALNCEQRSVEQEPCNSCPSCKEIHAGTSMDVLEIDGASNRGIEEIRRINETIGYASSGGRHRICIIDEVHMLTKEAFNALLKTLEEPPPNTLFLFATTEVHKVPDTILSRCQKFQLNRIPFSEMIAKLRRIVKDMDVEVDGEALLLIARSSQGGLRDAESLLDQVVAFSSGTITAEVITDVLGLMPRELLFELDGAGAKGELAFAFQLAHKVFLSGADCEYFVETLLDHYRTLLQLKVAGKKAQLDFLSPEEVERYQQATPLYSEEQLLYVLDLLIESQGKMKVTASQTIFLELILMKVIHSFQRVGIASLVKQLSDLQQGIAQQPPPPQLPQQQQSAPPSTPPQPQEVPQQKVATPPPPVQQAIQPQPSASTTPPAPPRGALQPPGPPPPPKKAAQKANTPAVQQPTFAKPQQQSFPVETGARLSPEAQLARRKEEARYDTLLHFAAVELEGSPIKGAPR